MSEDEGRIGTKGPAHWIIPNTFHPSRRTDVYNINTIPKGFNFFSHIFHNDLFIFKLGMFKMHHTCALYWGKIQVISGRMEYVVYEAEVSFHCCLLNFYN